MINLVQSAYKVRPILEEQYRARDCDRSLLAEIWRREIAHLPFPIQTVDDFLVAFEAGHLEHPETATRVRRKLQEKVESLRGDKWRARHTFQTEICNQLRFI